MSQSDYLQEEPEDEAFNMLTFSSGVQKRVMVILLLDTSGSMNGPKDQAERLKQEKKRPIDELNAALREWAASLRADSRLRHRAELAMITFGHGGVTTHDLGADGPFCPAALFEPPELEAGGVTEMVRALNEAAELSDKRKKDLDVQDIMRYRPLLFMITDGAPTDDTGTPLEKDEWQPMCAEIADLEARKKLAMFPAGVSGAHMDFLQALSPEGWWDLRRGSFVEFLRLVSASAGDADPIAYARSQLANLRSAAA